MSTAPASTGFFASAMPRLPGAAPLQRLLAGDTAHLAARRAHVLRVDSGCAWVTLGRGPIDGLGLPGVRGGDVFLHAGDALPVPAGTHAIVEAARGMELRFVWQPGDAIARQGARCAGAAPRAAHAPAACA